RLRAPRLAQWLAAGDGAYRRTARGRASAERKRRAARGARAGTPRADPRGAAALAQLVEPAPAQPAHVHRGLGPGLDGGGVAGGRPGLRRSRVLPGAPRGASARAAAPAGVRAAALPAGGAGPL